MPRSRGKAIQEFSGRTVLKKIWTAVSVAEWMDLFIRTAPDRKWTRNNNSIKCCCPYHDDHDPSFSLNFSSYYGKCWSCRKFVVDIVQFTAKLMGVGHAEALTYLNTELDLATKLGGDLDKLTEYHREEETKKQAAVAMTKLLEEYIRDKPDYLSYFQPALVYLTKGRKIPLGNLPQLPVRIFGKPEHMKKYMDPEYHDLYDDIFKESNKASYWGSVCFTYNDTPGTISAFKIRFKDDAVIKQMASRKEDLSKLTSNVARTLVKKEFTFIGKNSDLLGVFGLNHYMRSIGEYNPNAYITEGEFDALSVMSAQISSGTNDFPIFAVGGSAGVNLSFLRDYGIRTLYTLQDHPDNKGDVVVANWLKARGNHDGDATTPPLSFKIFVWPVILKADDLDNAINKFGYERILEAVYTNSGENFLNPLSWAKRHCLSDYKQRTDRYNNEKKQLQLMEKSDTALENLEHDYKHQVMEILRRWLGCLTDRLDTVQYMTYCHEQTGIDLNIEDKIYSSVNDLVTVDGCVLHLQEMIKEFITIPYFEAKATQNIFVCWSKLKNIASTITPSSEDNIESVISQFVKDDATNWVMRTLRNSVTVTPAGAEEKYKDNPTDLARLQRKNALFLLRKTFMKSAHEADSRDSLITVGQGIHYSDLKGVKDAIYFVNGGKIFKGTFNNSSSSMEWNYINDMRDGNYLFRLDNEPWSSTVNDVADLYFGMEVNKHAVYEEIINFLRGWIFENNEVMMKMLAAWILSVPIQLAVGHNNFVFLTGESTSGKSSFVQGLVGGRKNQQSDIPAILESSWSTTDASKASIYQKLGGSSIMLCLDEAESTGMSGHSQNNREIMEMMFGVPTGGSTVTRGSASGTESRNYEMKFPILMAATKLPRDDVFLTRVLVVYTKKDYSHKNVGDFIHENFTEPQVQKLKKSITTAFLADLPEVIERIRTLTAELRKIETNPPVTSRFIESVVAILAVYEMTGTADDPHDASELYKQIIEANRSRLETLLSASNQSDTITAILYKKAIAVTADGTRDMRSARDLIMEGGDSINILNNSNSGVYYIEDEHLLVFHWNTVRYLILSQIPSLRFMDVGALRESVAKNKYIMTNVDAKLHKKIVKEFSLKDAKTPAAYSVVDFRYLVDTDERNKDGAIENSLENDFENNLENVPKEQKASEAVVDCHANSVSGCGSEEVWDNLNYI